MPIRAARIAAENIRDVALDESKPLEPSDLDHVCGITIAPEGMLDPPLRLAEPALLRRFEPILCREGDSTCGADARAFLTQAEGQLNLLAGARNLEERLETSDPPKPMLTRDQRIAECRREAMQRFEDSAQSAATEWVACVTAIVPTRIQVPRNRFAMPQRGTLTIHRFGYWNPCWQRAVYRLESGDVLAQRGCESRNLAKPFERWTFAKVDPSAVRSAVLFAVLMDELGEGPAHTESFLIPARLNVFPAAFHRPIARYADVEMIYYSVEGVLREPVLDDVEADVGTDPRRRYLAQLLLALPGSSQAACATDGDRETVAHLWQRLQTDVHTKAQEIQEIARVFAAVRCPSPPGAARTD